MKDLLYVNEISMEKTGKNNQEERHLSFAIALW